MGQNRVYLGLLSPYNHNQLPALVLVLSGHVLEFEYSQTILDLLHSLYHYLDSEL